MSSLSHQGTPDNSNDSEAEAIAEKQHNGPSEYEMRRQANIAENQKLLANLGLSEGGGSAILGMSPTNEMGKKGKGKRYALCLFCLSNYYYLTFLQITSG
jgi:hypothetical protein